MAVIKFPEKTPRPASLQDVVSRFNDGEYLELYVVAIKADKTIEQLEFSQPFRPRRAGGSHD